MVGTNSKLTNNKSLLYKKPSQNCEGFFIPIFAVDYNTKLFAGGHEDKPNGKDQATECSKVIPL